MYNVQDYNVLYNKAVLCDCWHFTHMWKALVISHHFIAIVGLGPSNWLTPEYLIEMPVP